MRVCECVCVCARAKGCMCEGTRVLATSHSVPRFPLPYLCCSDRVVGGGGGGPGRLMGNCGSARTFFSFLGAGRKGVKILLEHVPPQHLQTAQEPEATPIHITVVEVFFRQ